MGHLFIKREKRKRLMRKERSHPRSKYQKKVESKRKRRKKEKKLRRSNQQSNKISKKRRTLWIRELSTLKIKRLINSNQNS